MFLGQCVEWGLTAHGESFEQATHEIRFLVGASIEWAVEDGEKYPEPISRRKFSGKFNVRMPAQLHQALVLEAERQGVSLNHWVIAKLSE
ncbi:MAG: toxin-antitoxin system HicB family antitoxin [Bradymonadaceae bacterium]|nr:toxin-antitoxin system HicB family antitoxin [Lujinxingiaceae bacterium]